MTSAASLERAALAKLLEGHVSEAEAPPSRDIERARLLHAYVESLRRVGISPEARSESARESPTESPPPTAPTEAIDLASALVDRLAVDPPMAELLAAAYRRLGIIENEVLSLAIDLGVAEFPRREVIRQRLADIVQVEERGSVFRTLFGLGFGGRPIELLLRLKECAIEAQAVEEFVSLANETIASLDSSPNGDLHDLQKAKAQVLGSDPADQGQAARAHKELIAQFEREDDVRALEAFVESRPSAEERHRERRWLYEWRASKDPRPGDVLASWAQAEEEYGEPGAAIAVYERLFHLDPMRRDALDALARLNLDAGNYAAALEPLRALRDVSDETGRRAINLGIARLLLEELGRPVEAADALSSLLAVDPPLAGAREMAQRLIGDPAARSEVVERFEQLANAADALTALRIFVFLAESPEEAQSGELRSRWLQRIVALAVADPPLALLAIIRGASEWPDELTLWEAAERIARDLGKTDLVSLAYHKVLASGAVAPSLAETLGRRMAAFEGECGTDSSRLIDALQRVLELAPEARWAIDRVKLVMGAQGRWDELFHLYDRAIDAAHSDRERTELLEEAAFAAKDLAVDPARAVHYLERGHALRPDDASIYTSLERLYERQGRKGDLIGLLSERVATCTGFELRQLRRRIADLWLDLGSAEHAMDLVRQGIDVDPTSVLDMVEVLERLVIALTPGPTQETPSAEARAAVEQAIALLRAHYERAERTDDVVRLAEIGLALADDEPAQTRRLRDVIDVCLIDAKRASAPFGYVLPRVEGYVAARPFLAARAYKMILVRAIRVRKEHPSPDDPARLDAESAAWVSIQRLKQFLLQNSDDAGARRLLHRGSRLPFAYGRRRELLATAAAVAAQRGEDRERAIRLFDELFRADAGDDAASTSLTTFAKLLDEAGEYAKLADLFEEQARIHGASGRVQPQCAFWERAAALWEAHGAELRAIAAYGQSAALGSEASFEALARIRATRAEWAHAAQALQWLCTRATASNRSARALRLSEAYVAIEERDGARACLEEALAKAEGEDATPVAARLIVLYRQDAIWGPLARLLASEARRTVDIPKKVGLLREAADILQSRLSDASQAASLLEEAIANSPREGELRPLLADVQETLERWVDVAATLQCQIEWYGELRSKERALTHQRRATALLRAGLGREALGELRVAVEMVPGEPSVLQDLARLALDLGQLDLAESTYRVLLLALHQRDETRDADLPNRARAFLDLSEIAARNGDQACAADWVDSAFDAAFEHGDDAAPLEETLGARGRYDLLARALERRVKRASTLTARAVALGHLASVWSQRLGKSAALAPRILEYAEVVGRDIDREDVTDAVAWAALSAIHSALGELGARLGGRDRLADLLESAISKTGESARRNGLRLTLAKMLLQAPSRSDAAIAVLAAAQKDDPTLAEASQLLADALAQEGRYDDLIAVLQKRVAGLSTQGDTAELVKASSRLGHALEETGRTDEARRVYEAIVECHPADPAILRDLAACLERLESGRLAETLELWIAADPQETEAIAGRLLAIRDQEGNATEATRVLEVGFAANPRSDIFRERLTRGYESSGQWTEAVRVLRRAADAEPESRTILFRLVAACASGGVHAEGIRILDAAIARTPRDGALLARRASLREQAGDGDGARSDLELAFATDSSAGPALIGLLERVVEGTASSPAVDDHTLRLIDLLKGAGESDRARQHLAALLERRPNHSGALNRSAVFAAADGDWEAAAAAYRRLLSGMGRDHREELVRVASVMVDAYERGGRVEQARESIERAIEAVPESHDLSRLLEHICEASGDRCHLAELLVARASREGHAGERIKLRLRAAALLLEAGAVAEAGTLIEDARATDPNNVEAVLLEASAHVAFGRSHEALALLGEAVEMCHGKRTPLLARVYLEIGKALILGDDLFEALDAIDYAVGVDRRNDEAAMLLGLLAIDLGDEKTAERALLAITTMPSRKDGAGVGPDVSTKGVAFYHLAALAYARGDVGKARRLASKAEGSGDPAHSAARALLERIDVQGAVAGPPL